MSQHVRRTITELETQAKRHDAAAQQARDMADRLRNLLTVSSSKAPRKRKAKTARTVKSTRGDAKPRKSRSATKRNGADGRSLATFVRHYLQERAQTKSGPATTADIYSAIRQLGYRFASKNPDNAVHYLRKVLRVNKAFKRTGRGKYTLA
jgi:hypothetical protein